MQKGGPYIIPVWLHLFNLRLILSSKNLDWAQLSIYDSTLCSMRTQLGDTVSIKYSTDLGIVTHQYSNRRNMIANSGYSLKMSNNSCCKGVIFVLTSLFIFAQVYSISFLSYTHLFTPLRNSKSFAPSGTEKTLITVPCNQEAI